MRRGCASQLCAAHDLGQVAHLLLQRDRAFGTHGGQVGHARFAAFIDEHAGGIERFVRDLRVAQISESLSRNPDHPQGCLIVNRSARRPPVGQAVPLDHLARIEIRAVGLARLIDGDDVPMGNLRLGTCPSDECLHDLGVLRQFPLQYLQRHGPAYGDLHGLIHVPLPA